MIRRTLKTLRRFANSAASPAESYREWWNASSPTMEAAYAATIAPMTESEYRSRGWNGDVNSYGARQLIEKGRLDSGSRVLEIGCGIARIGREMAPRVREWHGADISSQMIALARQRTSHLPNVFFHELPEKGGLAALEAGPFDFIYSTIVLMHLDMEDLFHYLKQAHRLLGEGGRAYFDTWNILHPDTFRIWREGAKQMIGPVKPRGRHQCCTPEEFRLYLEEAGFRVTALETDQRLVRAFCEKVPGGPAMLENDGWAPFGYLDNPGNDSEVNGLVTFNGWCLDRVARVEVEVGDLPPVTARYGGTWPPVVGLFPRYPDEARCGFECEVDTTSLPAGEHEVRVTATDLEGRQTRLTGEYWGVRVRKPE